MIDSGTVGSESTVAIVYRANSQSRALEEECVSRGLPYLMRGGAGTFYSRAEIKDCLCFLRLLYNGRDRSALMRAVRTPSRGIGDVALAEFIAYCEGVDVYFSDKFPDHVSPTPLDVLISLSDDRDSSLVGESTNKIPSAEMFMSKRAYNRFGPLSSQLRTLQKLASQQTVSALLSSIISHLDLRTHIDSISKTSDEFQDRWANIMELCQATERYNEDGPCLKQSNTEDTAAWTEPPLGQFLDDVALLVDVKDDTDSSRSDYERRVVANLMTIHASKGMEFDAVFLVGNEEGTFPTQRSISEGEGSLELDEERRLCYVAVTRAKTHLVLTWRKQVMTFFGKGVKVLDTDRSRFLNTLVAKKKTPKTRQGLKGADYNVSRKIQRPSPDTRPRSLQGMSVTQMPHNVPKEVLSRLHKAELERSNKFQNRGRNIFPREQSAKRSPQPRKRTPFVTSAQAQPPTLDSTMFFPIGSSVTHPVHGLGEVLPISNTVDSSTDGGMVVRVAFKCGIEIDLPLLNSGLQHVYAR